MGLPKSGLVQYPAAAHAGTLFVAEIGLPARGRRHGANPHGAGDGPWVNRTMPPRPADGQKGQFGRVALVAGARGFVGAAILSARGAIRAGAGLVTVGLPASLAAVLPASLPEAMTRALPETPDGTLAEIALEQIVGWRRRASVLAIGPGLDAHPAVSALVRGFLPRATCPVVADADALNVLGRRPEALRRAPAPIVITPHPGEMARLLGGTVADVQRDRVETARSAAATVGEMVVLKGARTVVACAGRARARDHPTGNGAMATGGMGDVLTGAVAALIAQGCPRSRRPRLAVYLHGRAGDLAARARRTGPARARGGRRDPAGARPRARGRGRRWGPVVP